MLKNAKAKGTRAEHRTMEVLTNAGYYCIRAGGSIGCFDVVAIGPYDMRCISVKSGSRYASSLEREQLGLVQLPPWATKEIWRWPDRCKAPLIERL
jgi:Holliday junction resolvase